jgi:ADP-heptose:LPS heptosyltransferase
MGVRDKHAPNVENTMSKNLPRSCEDTKFHKERFDFENFFVPSWLFLLFPLLVSSWQKKECATFVTSMPKFLIVRFSSIGDIVLTSPVIRCLKQQVKDAEVHFLTRKSFASVIEHNPFIDKKIYLDGELAALIPELKNENYDFVIDLHHNLRTFSLKSKLGKKSFSFNKLNIEKWLLVNFKINILPEAHIVDRYMETVKPLGVVNDGKGLDYFISLEDGEAPAALPSEFQKGFIAFVIGAKHNTKKLPVEKIISVCKKLQLPVVLMGGKEDFDEGERIAAAVKPQPIFNACGKFSLNGSAALIKQSVKVITHDTGMMHIAAAFKKEIISVWGNTVPAFGMYPYYGDFKKRNLIAEVLGLSCRPCSKIGFDKCPKGHFKCMVDQDENNIAGEANSAPSLL